MQSQVSQIAFNIRGGGGGHHLEPDHITFNLDWFHVYL